MKQAKGTHRSMGTKGGVTAGMESGVAETMSLKAGQGPDITKDAQRPKAVKGGSIAMK
ncbi:MAG: hypothetical protein Q8L60_10650 [Gammaproteobacteria bacterium]|nr:hypothetical protein [Gammaproteobacteria bacterium]MDP2346807.1 hypothetical protein [Gammaproteobacteria bacterium]